MKSIKNICGECGEHATLQCARCEAINYCCKAHQRSDWKEHKRVCPYLAREYSQEEKLEHAIAANRIKESGHWDTIKNFHEWIDFIGTSRGFLNNKGLRLIVGIMHQVDLNSDEYIVLDFNQIIDSKSFKLVSYRAAKVKKTQYTIREAFEVPAESGEMNIVFHSYIHDINGKWLQNSKVSVIYSDSIEGQGILGEKVCRYSY